MLSDPSERATIDGPALRPSVCAALERVVDLQRSTRERLAPPHPAVVKYAEQHGLMGLRAHNPGGWLATLAVDGPPLSHGSKLYHLTHIAKTGGRSVHQEIKELTGHVAGAEQCHPPFVHQSRINIVFLREPRRHVISMYLHGASVGRNRSSADRERRSWVRRQLSGYPMGMDALGLHAWLRHFSRGWTPTAGDFRSYNPLNMQARSLTCRATHWNADFVSSCDEACSHHTGPNASDARPSLEAALGVVRAVHFVGVTELLPEALCVLEYRVTGAASTDCARPRPVVRNPAVDRFAHANLGVSGLAPPVLAELDAVSVIDQQVYKAALVRLLCEIRALEAATQRQILTAERSAAAIDPGAVPVHTWRARPLALPSDLGAREGAACH